MEWRLHVVVKMTAGVESCFRVGRAARRAVTALGSVGGDVGRDVLHSPASVKAPISQSTMSSQPDTGKCAASCTDW